LVIGEGVEISPIVEKSDPSWFDKLLDAYGGSSFGRQAAAQDDEGKGKKVKVKSILRSSYGGSSFGGQAVPFDPPLADRELRVTREATL